MMFTAMIIDDETTVREGIKALIAWEAEGFCLGKLRKGRTGRSGKYPAGKPRSGAGGY